MTTNLTIGATTLVGTATGTQSQPEIATFADGSYVIVWTSNEAGSEDIYQQRYLASGQPDGGRMLVHTTTSGFQNSPSISGFADGSYVVAWASSGNIALQRFGSNGQPVGSGFQVDTGDFDQSPSVTTLADGGFILAWNTAISDGRGYLSVLRLDAAGTPVGSQPTITGNASVYTPPAIEVLDDGSYVLTWLEGNDLSSDRDLFSMLFAADGTPAGAATYLRSAESSGENGPTVTELAAGGYVIGWDREAQIFDADGEPVGSPLTGFPGEVRVTALSGGGFVVVTTGIPMLAQRYSATGEAVGESIVVSNAFGYDVTVGELPNDGFVVSWQVFGSSFDVYTRTYLPDAATLLTAAEQVSEGTSGDDVFTADPGALGAGDHVFGGAGTDTLQLNAAGTLDLAAPVRFSGIESIQGSSGDDTFVVSHGLLRQDSGGPGIATIAGGSGTDTISFASSVDLSDVTLTGIERLVGTGSGSQSIILNGSQAAALTSIDAGAGGDQIIVGAAGTFDLSGVTLTGVESLRGSSGDDTLVLASAQMSGLTVNGAGGTDTLRLGAAGTLDLRAFSSLSSIEAVEGSAGDDTIVVNATRMIGISTLSGGSGTDTLTLVDPVSFAGRTVSGFEKITVGAGFYAIDAGLLTGVTSLEGDGTSLFDHLDLSALSTGVTLDLRAPVNGSAGGTTVSGFVAGKITGGSGDDRLTGGGSSFDLIGGSGSDQLDAGTGFTGIGKLTGGNGNDTLISNVAPLPGLTLALDGGADIDVAVIDRSASGRSFNLDLGDLTLTTSLGDGTTILGVERIEFTAGRGNDNLAGGALADMLSGGAGRDVLDGRDGDDTLLGGAGIDLLSGGEGDDSLSGGDSADTLDGEGGNDTLDGGAGVDDLFGGAGNDSLLGGASGDRLTGEAGDDTLDGGTGVDQMAGELDDDTYYVDDSRDRVLETAGEGRDLVYATASFVLEANVEDLRLLGTADLNATGNDLANEILGNSGANVLDGAGGADTLAGGAGDDTYIVDGGDTITELAAGGTDTVRSSATLELGAEIENLVLTGIAAISGKGNTLANVIEGNAAQNTLNGGAGIDTMIGGAGNDIYLVDRPQDAIVELIGEGIDSVRSTGSYSLADAVENLTIAGTGNTTGTGNSLDNVLTGGAGNNILIGNLGDDTLNGGAGNDTMRGGEGADIYVVDSLGDVVEETGSDVDTVRASVSYTLGAGVENLVFNGTGDATLAGNASANLIVGGAGNDVLSGGLGMDSLRGGAGQDDFVFDTALNASTNSDHIVDFAGADDTIRLDDAIFTTLSTGALSASAFKDLASGAVDADDRLIYDSGTGSLFYDEDGSGAGVRIRFAILDNRTALTADDFLVV